MEVGLLGPLQVQAAGRLVPLGGTRQRAVLAMLVLQVNQVVTVDRLVEGLWGVAPPAGGSTPCRSTCPGCARRCRRPISRVGGVVVRRRPGYLLALDADQVDLYVPVPRLARQGMQALAGAPGRAAALLAETLGLWRGAALAEFGDEPFAQAEIPRLEEQRLAALQARIDADLAVGWHTGLVGELETLAAQHPLREQLHRQLILSLYRSGRQGEALAGYRRVRQLLADAGGGPGPGVAAAGSRHLGPRPPAGLDPTPGPPDVVESAGTPPAPTSPAELTTASATTAAGPLPAGWNVPARNPHFVGRADLLDQLHQRLGAGEQMLVVQALHGLGKTQLAIEYAHRFAADYQLIWWIDAEQPALLAGQLAALAGPLGLPTGASVAETVERVVAELRRRPDWLLIFDNAERPQHLAGYLPGGAGQVLVTSRHPGWGGLGGRLEVDVLTRADTITLLRRRLPDLAAGLADQLAGELGDLPLAAAQVAGYLEQTGLAPAAYLHRFRIRQASLLAKGEVVGYHGRLDTTWTLSLDQLQHDSPAAVQVLQLAAFLAPEPIPLSLFTGHAELLAEPLRTVAADPDLPG